MFQWRKSTASGFTKDLPHGKARFTGGEVFCRGPYNTKVTPEQYIEDMKEVLAGADQQHQEAMAALQAKFEKRVAAIKAVLDGGVQGILADLPQEAAPKAYGRGGGLYSMKAPRAPVYPAGDFGNGGGEEID